MSSVFGHSLAAIAIYSTSSNTDSKLNQIAWLGWLIFVALVPDLDHFFPILHQSANNNIRITHTILFCSILPAITTLLLWILRSRGHELKTRTIQVFSAGLSHLVLDMLVGIAGFYLLWPFSDFKPKLPFGLLPSAGKLALDNYYLYANLVLELGVLLPLFYISIVISKGWRTVWKKRWSMGGCLLVCLWFMRMSFNLVR